MTQEINLYQPLFRREKVVFSASTLVGLLIGFGLLFVAWGALSGQRVEQLADELDRRQATEQQLAGRLTDLRTALDSRAPSRELERQIASAETRRTRLEASRIALQEQVPDRPLELVDVLGTLGRLHPDGLWLTRIEVADNGRRLVLEGQALTSERVPVLIEALRGQPPMDGMSFREMNVDAGSGESIRFRASAERDPP